MSAEPPEQTERFESRAAAAARAAPRDEPTPPWQRVGGTLLGVLRGHWLFAVLVLAGVALRVVTQAAYRPAIFGITDSYWYLEQSENLGPAELRPFGYPLFLKVLPLGWGLEVVTVLQHLLGLLIALLVYSLLLRLGVRRWLAALAGAPPLLDAYVLNVEHQVLAETLFHAVLAGAAALLLWRRPLTWPLAAAAGLLLASAALTRSVGAVLILPALAGAVFLAGSGRRLAVTGALFAAFAVPLGGYAVWFHSHHDVYGLSRTSGRFLYGRVAPIVDCTRFAIPVGERVLCPKEPLGERLDDYAYMWGNRTPVNDVVPPPGKTQDEVAGTFARRVVRNQPVDYAELVLRDFARGYLSPTKESTSSGYRVHPWQFQERFPIFYLGQTCPPGPGEARSYSVGCERRARKTAGVLALYGHERGTANEGLTSFLRAYQSLVYVPGPLLLAALLVAIAGAVGVGRARSSGLRTACLLLAGLALSLALASAIASSFSWRYQLPQLFLLPGAAALAITAITGRRERRDRTDEAGPRSP